MGEAVMTTRRQADGAVVVDVRGSLDATTIEAVRTAVLDSLHRDRPRLITVDLTYVTFMDSMGIGMLVAGHQAAHDLGARFVLRNPSDFVHRQLSISGLTELFGLPASVAAHPYRA